MCDFENRKMFQSSELELNQNAYRFSNQSLVRRFGDATVEVALFCIVATLELLKTASSILL
jgi:hypothetical protein